MFVKTGCGEDRAGQDRPSRGCGSFHREETGYRHPQRLVSQRHRSDGPHQRVNPSYQ